MGVMGLLVLSDPARARMVQLIIGRPNPERDRRGETTGWLSKGLCCKHLGPPNDTAPFLGSGNIGEMLIEHVHGLGHGRGTNAK